DQTLANTAVEELLRYDSPPQFVSRVVVEPHDRVGKALRAGDSVLPGIAARTAIRRSSGRQTASTSDRRPTRTSRWGSAPPSAPSSVANRLPGDVGTRQARAAAGSAPLIAPLARTLLPDLVEERRRSSQCASSYSPS